MPNINANEIATQRSVRNYIQWGGAKPANPPKYAGVDGQYVIVTGVSVADTGDISPIYIHSPARQGSFRLVNRSYSAPDLPAGTVTFLEKYAGVARHLLESNNCPLNIYEVHGACGDLSDLAKGWTDYVLIYEGGIVTTRDLGDRTAWSDDNQLETAVSVTFSYVYPVGSMSFGEKALTQIDREIVDLVYASSSSCVGCDLGYKNLYALAQASGAGSPGLPAEVVYSIDYGSTFSQINIDGLGATELVYAIEVVGKYLVVVGTDAYYFSELNTLTGVPGTFTKVSTGFVASKSPRDMYVLGTREVFFVGLGGYIYKATDITTGVTVVNAGEATTSDLGRIKGRGDVMVAVGVSGAIVKSTNRGLTWATTTTTPSGSTMSSVEVISQYIIWVGTGTTGRIYSTQDGGETWTELVFSGSGSGNVWDIAFPTDSVGYFSHSTTTPTARVFATLDGGSTWARGANRIMNLPTFNKASRLAYPATESAGWMCNVLAIGGVGANGTDGILLIGASNIQ